MKRSVHWILWIILILVFILIFPKNCGPKIKVSEDNQNTISEADEGANIDENIIDEDVNETIIDDSEPPLYDEGNLDETFYNEDILNNEPPLEGGVIQVDSDLDSNKTKKYNCYGLWDGLIAKINQNSSIQWCYGVCIITPEEIKDNKEIKNQSGDNSIALGIFASFSNLALILGIIIGAIIILGIIRYVLTKLETIDR